MYSLTAEATKSSSIGSVDVGGPEYIHRIDYIHSLITSITEKLMPVINEYPRKEISEDIPKSLLLSNLDQVVDRLEYLKNTIQL